MITLYLDQKKGKHPVQFYQFNRHDTYLNISTIHIGSADVSWPIPLAEEHVAPVGVYHDGAGPLQVAQQGASVVLVLGAEYVQGALPININENRIPTYSIHKFK